MINFRTSSVIFFTLAILTFGNGCNTTTLESNQILGSWKAPDGALITFNEDKTVSVVTATGEDTEATYSFLDSHTVQIQHPESKTARDTFTFSINGSTMTTKQKDGLVDTLQRVSFTNEK
jgi:hypothetical protein